jgi:hypothetical protein
MAMVSQKMDNLGLEVKSLKTMHTNHSGGGKTRIVEANESRTISTDNI